MGSRTRRPLQAELAQLSPADSAVLAGRIKKRAPGDPVAAAIAHFVPERRARLLELLGGARRRAAIAASGPTPSAEPTPTSTSESDFERFLAGDLSGAALAATVAALDAHDRFAGARARPHARGCDPRGLAGRPQAVHPGGGEAEHEVSALEPAELDAAHAAPGHSFVPADHPALTDPTYVTAPDSLFGPHLQAMAKQRVANMSPGDYARFTGLVGATRPLVPADRSQTSSRSQTQLLYRATMARGWQTTSPWEIHAASVRVWCNNTRCPVASTVCTTFGNTDPVAALVTRKLNPDAGNDDGSNRTPRGPSCWF